MAVTTPDWLTQRGGELRSSKDGRFRYTVYLAGEPQYLLLPVPVGGKHACRVSQTINGRRLDGSPDLPTRRRTTRRPAAAWKTCASFAGVVTPTL